MPEYVHLHNHTHYSLLDGAMKVDDLVQAAVDNKMPAVGLTDHGVMFGAIEFYKKAKKAGIKPIIGCEVYILTKGSRFEKTMQATESGGKRGAYHHMILLAKNLQGYKNLIKLCTIGHTEGFYYKPRIDTEVLRRYSEGLIGTSACAGGVVGAQLANGEDAEAYAAAELYKDILGDDFYIEMQNHGIKREAIIREKAPKLAKDLGLKLICSNDVHYLKRDHAIAHNIMLLIPDSSSTSTQDYTQLRYQTDQVYFKPAKEMIDLFREFPEALNSTVEVMEKCNLELDLKTNHMPRFPIPADAGVETLDDYFEKLAHEGFTQRYPEPGDELKARLKHEVAVIRKMGYAGYFLIVQDFIAAARRMGVSVGPGRGSAAGSIVSYALGITNVDPVKYDLLFERFLNPDRVSMPDIDVDFSDDKREKVIQYVREKYGAESVSQIITFGTLSSRAVLKDVGRVLGVPLSTIDSITKQIPVELGKVRPLADALATIPDLKWVKESSDPKIKTLIDASLVLEGMNRGAGMHAAGVVIAPGNISDFVPLFKTPSTEMMTQFNMKDLETAGLLKMDFLGLRTLSVLENALAMIKHNHGVDINLDALPEDDAKTFELFSRGGTIAVFQFESSGMQDWLRRLKPTSISDLVAMNALYRPGPMEMIGDFIERKHGRQQISYMHPKMESILKETYGVIVYQEQVMKIATEIAGFTLAKADLMRRAMGKKNKEEMAKLKVEFIDGAVSPGTQKKLAGEIFDLIEKFASYGFNKSHSVAYSVIAYQTAYLKAHYPAEYMAATLSSEIGDTDKIVMLIDDCRKLGIEVLPPDVNESGTNFVVVNGAIRFGLCAIKGVGELAIESVIKARDEEGKFENLFDFCRRVDLRLVNKKCLESLVQAGAFDTMTGHRAQYFENIERAANFGAAFQEQALNGQSSLFDMGDKQGRAISYPALPPIAQWTEHEKLLREKNVLGFYVSGHPLLKFEQEVNEFSNVKFGDLSSFKTGSSARACGIISSVKKKIDKRGNTMAFVTMEDFTGRAELIVFSDQYAKFQQLLQPDSMVMIIGKGEVNGDALKVLVNEVYPMEKVREKFTRSIILSINVNDVKENTIVELRSLLEKNKGNCACYFDVVESAKRKKYQSRKFSVDPTDQFMEEARRILGVQNVKLAS
ncbi:MAG: DNA polymerase III subunit alpha [Ignavibacteriae bacterium]|nr:DNA polymerase III subunit alpha [Ignavibacteriota bacterium]